MDVGGRAATRGQTHCKATTTVNSCRCGDIKQTDTLSVKTKAATDAAVDNVFYCGVEQSISEWKIIYSMVIV